MGEKVEENFSEKNQWKNAGPECRAAGPSRHAEAVTEHGAEFDLLEFLTQSVSDSPRALAVRSNNFRSTRPPRLLTEITLYSPELSCSSTLLVKHCLRSGR